jgi:transcriptional regulator with XRE-family HTH domain
MKDEEIAKLLELTICSEHSPELTDEVVDAILSKTVECPPDKTARVRTRFVEKILWALHHEPVRRIDHKWTLGRWVEAVRESVRLTRADVATALGQDVAFIERLERGELTPWECPPDSAANLMRLFRIHISAMAQLVSNSAAVSQSRGVGSVAARSRGGHASSDRGESTKRALDLFLAHNAAPAKPDSAVTNWIEAVREALRRRQLTDLLD